MTFVLDTGNAGYFVYRGAERREPSTTERGNVTFDLQYGGVSWATEVNNHVTNTETVAIVYPIMRAYQGYFGRVPDNAGLTYWCQVFRDNATNFFGGAFSKDNLVATTQGWAGSTEFVTKYGSLSNSDYVTQLYVNLYARNPDTAGRDYWAGLLDAGSMSRAQVMVEFTEAAEFQTRANGAIANFLTAACYFNAGGGASPYNNQSLV